MSHLGASRVVDLVDLVALEHLGAGAGRGWPQLELLAAA
jgi:hypothetical protein